MNKNEKKFEYWDCTYVCSYTGSKVTCVVEPHKCNYTQFSKEDVEKQFSENLDKHVQNILTHLKTFAENKPLIRRLHKYNNKEGLQILLEVHRILHTLPKFK